MPTQADILRFHHEYHILSKLNVKGVPTLYQNLELGNLILALRDIGGKPIKDCLACPLDLAQFFTISLQLARILDQIHQANIIHKDIHPGNILWNPDSAELQIIDFNLATEFEEEHPEISSVHSLEGTLPYMSPEQTSRMNCSIDYRADYYALGITCFELLTGTLPLNATDTLGWIYQHISQTPILAHQIRPEVPDIVSQILYKLMSKNADDRYQGLFGLIRDLEKCQQEWAAHQKIESFSLAQSDIPRRFILTQKFVGRTQERSQLIQGLHAASEGETSLALVVGPAGIGKSALVQNLHKYFVQYNAHFISGKYDQFSGQIPYTAIRQAFITLVNHLLLEPDTLLNEWKHRIQKALDTNAQLIIDLIPELELIIGKQKPVQEVNPELAKNRFCITFRFLIKALGTKTHPLVLFLDNLQWADPASLELLEEVMYDPEIRYVYIIGAYRDSEIKDNHPLRHLQTKIAEHRVVQIIPLFHLSCAEVNQLIAATLHISEDQTPDLAEVVLVKTEGNPHYIGELLNDLYHQHYLAYSPESGKWQWDIPTISATALSRNVVAKVIHQIDQLPELTQGLLTLGACIGSEFDLRNLALITRKGVHEVMKALIHGIALRMIMPIGRVISTLPAIYETTPECVINIHFRFCHEDIQRTMYDALDPVERAKYHAAIGQALLCSNSESFLEDHLLEIVHHLNIGENWIQDPLERKQIAAINLRASRKAKQALAYETAFRTAKSGITFLPEDCWITEYDLTFALHSEAADTAFLTQAAEIGDAEINTLVKHSKSALETARIYSIQTKHYVALGKYEAAIKIGLHAIRRIRPFHTSFINAIIDFFHIQWLLKSKLKNRSILELSQEPELTDPVIRMIYHISIDIGISAYLTGKLNLFFYIIIRDLVFNLKYGNSGMGAMVYSAFAMMLTMLNRFETARSFGNLSVQLAERIEDNNSVAITLLVNSITVIPKTEPWHVIHDTLKRSITYGYRSGDITFLCLALNLIGYFQYPDTSLGIIIRDMQKNLALIKSMRQDKHAFTQVFPLTFAQALCGQTTSRLSFSTPDYDEDQLLTELKKQKSANMLAHYYSLRIKLYVLYHMPDEALSAEDQIRPYQQALRCTPEETDYILFSFLAITAHFSRAPKSFRLWLKIQKNYRKMKIWAGACPSNFHHQYKLMAAEIARHKGQYYEAVQAYESALSHAETNGFIRDQAIISEWTGRFYLAHQQNRLARVYLQQAYQLYLRWGATEKLTHMRETYPEIFSSDPDPACEAASKNPVPAAAASLDMATLIHTFQTLAGEVNTDQIIRKIIRFIMENTGARKAAIIFSDDSNTHFYVHAYADQTTLDSIPQTPIPLEESQQVCSGIVNYVIRTQQPVLVHQAQTHASFQHYPYIQNEGTQSILAIPLMVQSLFKGVLYLDNNKAANVFTPDRINLINLLASQAAISLEYANVVSQLENKVNRRNTELMQAIYSLKIAKEDADKTSHYKSLFLAQMTHELRTPLHVINGVLDMLSRNAGITSDPKLLRSVDIAQKSAERQLQLVNSILDISKAESGNLQLNLEPIVMLMLFAGITEQMELLLANKPVTFVLDMPNNLQAIVFQADRIRLGQVITNLLSNAAKFTQQGEIRLSVHRTPENRLLFSVRDTGIGMSESNCRRLFDTYVMIENDLQNQYRGTGLGLAICKQFVEAHGGEISVTSELGIGTEFQFWIPLMLGGIEPNLPQESRDSDIESLKTKRILMCDDDDYNLIFAQMMFEGKLEYALAQSAEDAVSKLKNQSFDLMFLDLHLGNRDGRSVLQEIRTFNTALPVVALTADTQKGLRDELITMGFSEYIAKPFKEDELFRFLIHFFNKTEKAKASSTQVK